MPIPENNVLLIRDRGILESYLELLEQGENESNRSMYLLAAFALLSKENDEFFNQVFTYFKDRHTFRTLQAALRTTPRNTQETRTKDEKIKRLVQELKGAFPLRS